MRHAVPIGRALSLLLTALLLGCAAKPPLVLEIDHAPPPPLPQPAPFKKVFIIVFENADAADALKQPFFRDLASRGALLTAFSWEDRPSQPNYLALTSGSTHGVQTNANVNFDVRHLGNLLEEHGRSWKSYAEDYPGNCFLGAKSPAKNSHYVRKHEPFLSYKNVQSVPERCRRVVGLAELDADIEHGLPDFSLFIPNNEHNGHKPKNVAFADGWFKKTFEERLLNPKFMDGMLFVVTFDESDKHDSAPVYTVLYGDGVQAGVQSEFPYNHYSLLRTIEEAFGLGTLGREDDKAVPIGGIWRQ